MKKKTNKIRQERDLLQSFMNSATNAHLVYLDPNFNFVRVNKTYADTCGYLPEEMIGKNHFDLYPSAEMEKIFRKVRDNGKPVEIHDRPFEFPDQPGRGVTYWDWTLVPTKDAGDHVNGLIFSLFETTARVRAEEKLIQSEDRFAKAFTSSPAALAITRFSDGRYIEVNNSLLKMLGYRLEEMIGHTATELGVYQNSGQRDELVSILKNKGKITNKEIRFWGKGKRQIETILSMEIIVSGGEALILSSIIDLTKLKEAEQAMIAAHLQTQSIIDRTTSIIYAFDLKHHFLLANRALAQLFKLTPEDLIGKRRHAFMPKEDADWHEKNDLKVIKAGQVLEFEEYSNLNDRKITWLTTKFPLYDEKGQIYAVAGISADISEHKRFEDELKKANSTLEERVHERTEELQKLNAALLRSNRELENFAYITSHDLQEPLRTITSFTQLLAQKYGNQLDQNAGEYIGFIVDGAKRMYELINGLLEYSRIGRSETRFTEVNLNRVISDIRSNLDLVIKERNCIIESDVLPVVFADRTQVMQLFQNLVSNGIKFCNENPHITISVQRKESVYVFSVRDNGIGIESKYFNKIFEIFKRLHHKDQYPGTGMGLAICKRIVENHNGKIWIESEPGHGTVFYFTLPGVEN